MSDVATWLEMRASLAEAEAAYHRLMTGGGTTWVAFGAGRSVSYSAANAGRLLSYINELRERIGTCCSEAANHATGRRAPIRFEF
jgi:hypothetical protein